MKRTMLVLLVLAIIMTIVACANRVVDDSNQAPDTEESQPPEQIVLEIVEERSDIPTFDYMVAKTDNIIIGKVADVLPSVSMTRKELGIGNSETDRIFTSIEVEVIENLKGTFKKGDSVRLEQDGGTVGKTTVVVKDAPLLEKGTTYLIFIYEPKSRSEGEYFDYVVPDPFDGYVKIVDGIIQPHKYSRFYKEETSIDVVKEWINNA